MICQSLILSLFLSFLCNLVHIICIYNIYPLFSLIFSSFRYPILCRKKRFYFNFFSSVFLTSLNSWNREFAGAIREGVLVSVPRVTSGGRRRPRSCNRILKRFLRRGSDSSVRVGDTGEGGSVCLCRDIVFLYIKDEIWKCGRGYSLTFARTHIQTGARKHTTRDAHRNVGTRTRTYKQTYKHAHAHTLTNNQTHTHTDKQTPTHTYPDIHYRHKHTHILENIRICVRCLCHEHKYVRIYIYTLQRQERAS